MNVAVSELAASDLANMLLNHYEKSFLYNTAKILCGIKHNAQILNWCILAKMITSQLKRLAHRAS